MQTLQYEAPSGECLPNPSLDQMLVFMRKDYDDYWGPYSPVGVLRWDHSLRTSETDQLLFVRHPDLGWYFEFNDSVTYNTTSDGEDAWVKHWAFGEPMYFRVNCFVSQHLGEQVVTEYLASGRPSDEVSWAGTSAVVPRMTEEQRRDQRRREKRKR